MVAQILEMCLVAIVASFNSVVLVGSVAIVLGIVNVILGRDADE